MDDQTATKNPLEELKDTLQDLLPNFPLVQAIAREVERRGLAPMLDGGRLVLAGQTRQEQAQSALGLAAMMIETIGLEAARRGIGTWTNDGLLLVSPEDMQSVLAEDAGAAILKAVMSTLQERQAAEDQGGSCRRRRVGEDLLHIGSGPIEQALYRTLSQQGLLKMEPGATYPRASFRLGGQTVSVELSPPEAEGTFLLAEQEALLAEKMGAMARQLGAVEAVVFAIMQDHWVTTARHPDERVRCDVDYILEARGIKPRRNSEGRAGGYRPEQRAEVIAAVNRLRHLSFDADYKMRQVGKGKAGRLVTVRHHGRAIEISDTVGVGQGHLAFDAARPHFELRSFLFSPGPMLSATLFGNQEVGRLVARLNRKVLTYDAKYHAVPQALALHLAMLWRCGASRDGVGPRRLRPAGILEAIGLKVDKGRPSETKRRLEAALDKLRDDGVIAGWEWDPERWDEAGFQSEQRHRAGWVEDWKDAACLLVEAPPEIVAAYRGLSERSLAASRKRALPAKAEPEKDLGRRLQERREALGLTRLQAAEQAGVDRTSWGRLESGSRAPSKRVAELLRRWLEAPV